MHSLEALLASFDVLHNNELYEICTRIINFVLSLFNNSEFAQLLPEHFTNTWQPIKEYNVEKKDDQFKPYGATIGHSFEWSRLLLQYAYTFEDKIGKAKFDSIILIAISMFDKAEEFGWDQVNQGYVYTVDFKGNTIISDRMHWVICEAINTSRALYEITNNPKYKDITLRNENYISKYIIEKDGSWIHQLSKDNKLITTVWNGKPDIYHAVQCSLELSFKHSIAKSSIQKEI
jgi:mannose/cellobiose epimerase-like protein (N-acyl-D-glucosamine 2-epimerase family)